MGWIVTIQIKKALNRDVLQLIAEQINDRRTWHSFALANSVTAAIVRRLTDQKRRELDFFYGLTDDELLQFDPNLNDHNTIAWTQNLGHQMIREVNIDIGGQTIDTQFGEWNTVWNDLTVHRSQEEIDWLNNNAAADAA